ncbi:uncharacterized protein LOC109608369 [Aethina tumida]|uniref:uncharacterized protein LOC109608369 n=1 Tax=Aethina tumida TaxID=116153 RepID=UPI00096AE53B|nr:uncharacterized protein LOC109608369 [Aethina tumida]XP_049817511.1 uncharacterized protein LOC109608369 [Aethina tumida]XP_049817512.1 uncharacterized protein LOC109608369 [Aethina tumida]
MQAYPTSISSLYIWWIYFVVTVSAFAVPRTKDYKSGEVVLNKHAIEDEPTCNELKEMWRFSKRQSRAAEITNEIPMARDPFSDNIWEPYYATSRSIGGMRLGRYRSRPVYGRVVHKVPYLRIQDVGERNKAFGEVARLYGTVQRPNEPRRRYTTFRVSGGSHLPQLGFPPQSGSFQHLKELIKTERARELQEQRRAEEAAAKAAAIKLIESDNHRNQKAYHDMNLKYDLEDLENDRSGYMATHGDRGLIGFPDTLAPASRNTRYVQDYAFSRPRPRTLHFFDPSSYNTGFNGYLV